jgi:hypothetical protein
MNFFCGVCVRSAALALIGSGIIRSPICNGWTLFLANEQINFLGLMDKEKIFAQHIPTLIYSKAKNHYP